MDQTRHRTGARFELVGLADYPLLHLDEPLPANMGQYQNAHSQDWTAPRAGSGTRPGEARLLGFCPALTVPRLTAAPVCRVGPVARLAPELW